MEGIIDPLDDFFKETEQVLAARAKRRHDSSDSDNMTDEVAPESPQRTPPPPRINTNELTKIVKDIYVEPEEQHNLSSEDIQQLRDILGGIVVHGLNVPTPFSKWAQCGLPEQVMSLINYLGFIKPTAIQCQAIPCILKGRDVIGCAVCGSGKTLAFVLPALLHCLSQEDISSNQAIAIFLSPTRELAIQTHLETQRFFRTVGLESACLVGGNDIKDQIRSIKNGAHAIIATPGRFIDLIVQKRWFNVSRISFFVIDEADRMFDLGFEPQVHRIAAILRPDRQSLMFSATFPHSVERNARKLLKHPIEIVVGSRNSVAPSIEQHFAVIPKDQKLRMLLKVLGDFQDIGQALVFVNQQDSAETLFDLLLKRGFKVALLHAGMEQVDRASLLHEFRQQAFKVLVLTSVGSRGIDIVDVALVVNYDAPDHEADYVHRTGRTGRAGRHGNAWTFIEPDQFNQAAEIVAALKRSKTPIPTELEEMVSKKEIKRRWGFGGHGYQFSSIIVGHKRANKGVEGIIETANGSFIRELCINDFPQPIRDALTLKDTRDSVMEETGVTITQKGRFYPPGQKPSGCEKKLCLIIEGYSRLAVQTAEEQLMRVADETEYAKDKSDLKYTV